MKTHKVKRYVRLALTFTIFASEKRVKRVALYTQAWKLIAANELNSQRMEVVLQKLPSHLEKKKKIFLTSRLATETANLLPNADF